MRPFVHCVCNFLCFLSISSCFFRFSFQFRCKMQSSEILLQFIRFRWNVFHFVSYNFTVFLFSLLLLLLFRMERNKKNAFLSTFRCVMQLWHCALCIIYFLCFCQPSNYQIDFLLQMVSFAFPSSIAYVKNRFGLRLWLSRSLTNIDSITMIQQQSNHVQ